MMPLDPTDLRLLELARDPNLAIADAAARRMAPELLQQSLMTATTTTKENHMYKITNSCDRHVVYTATLHEAYEVAATWTGASAEAVEQSCLRYPGGIIIGGDDPLGAEADARFGGIRFTITITTVVVIDFTATIGGVPYDVRVISGGTVFVRRDERYVEIARLVVVDGKVKVSVEEASFSGKGVEAALTSAVLEHLRETIGGELIATDGGDRDEAVDAPRFLRQLAEVLGINWDFRSWNETGLALRGGRLGGISFE